MERLHGAVKRALEVVSLLILMALLAVVTVAVACRYSGLVFSWYDELASILLAWLTYIGAALAALRRGHLGFDNVVRALPAGTRRAAFALSEAATIGFFACLGWGGWMLLPLLQGETLVSMPFIPSIATQSIIPLAAALFVLAEILSMPAAWRRISAGPGDEAGGALH